MNLKNVVGGTLIIAAAIIIAILVNQHVKPLPLDPPRGEPSEPIREGVELAVSKPTESVKLTNKGDQKSADPTPTPLPDDGIQRDPDGLISPDVPFEPAVAHGPIVTLVPVRENYPQLPEKVTPKTLHSFRSADVKAPAITPVGPNLITTTPRMIADEMLQVQTEPGVPVLFFASQLGTFANGQGHIIVTADSKGLATVQFRAGRDGGDYPVYAASPTRSGMVKFIVEVTEDE